MGIAVLPPDVNRPGLDFTVEGNSVRFGLSAIKNVGEGAIRSILEARRRRSGLPRRCFELCARSTCASSTSASSRRSCRRARSTRSARRRSQLAAAVDAALEYGAEAAHRPRVGPVDLLRWRVRSAGRRQPAPSLPDLPDWDERTRLAHEKATLGFYVSGPSAGEPSASCSTTSPRTRPHACATPTGSRGRGGRHGHATCRRRKSKKGAGGHRSSSRTSTGRSRSCVFPKAYEQFQALLENDRAVLVNGRVESEDERVQPDGRRGHPARRAARATGGGRAGASRWRPSSTTSPHRKAAKRGRGAPRRGGALPRGRATGGLAPGGPRRALAAGRALARLHAGRRGAAGAGPRALSHAHGSGRGRGQGQPTVGGQVAQGPRGVLQALQDPRQVVVRVGVVGVEP